MVFHSDHKWNFGNCVVVCAAMLHQGAHLSEESRAKTGYLSGKRRGQGSWIE